jgi:Domain of unknown function (DUF4136)
MSTARILAVCTAAVATVVTLAGCTTASSPVRVDQAESGLPKCSTFQWLSPSQDAASFTEQRVRDATLETLKAKGYAVATEGADCRVSYVFAASEPAKSKPSVGVGAGGGSGGVGGGIGVSIPVGRRDKYSGTLTIDVIDSARNAQVWSGSLDASFAAAEMTQQEANEAVKTVLAKFPDASTADQK